MNDFDLEAIEKSFEEYLRSALKCRLLSGQAKCASICRQPPEQQQAQSGESSSFYSFLTLSS